MIRPAKKTVRIAIWLLCISVLLTASVVLLPTQYGLITSLLGGAFVALLFLGFVDYLLILPANNIGIDRSHASTVFRNQRIEVRYAINIRFRRPLRPSRIYIEEVPVAGIAFERIPELNVAEQFQRNSAFVVAERRGHYEFKQMIVYIRGPLGLVGRYSIIPVESECKVYPRPPVKHRGMLVARQSERVGLRKSRLSGRGEFERLREYQKGDEYRHVDWKATARMQKLIVRHYQAEQNQKVIFMLDCGSRMLGQTDNRQLFETVLTGLLNFTTVAGEQQDLVGFLAFDRKVLRSIPPDRNNTGQIIEACYDLYPSAEPANYSAAFHEIMKMTSGRSLIFIVTDIRDDSAAEILLESCQIYRKKHLPVVFLFRPKSILNKMKTSDAAFREAAQNYLEWRQLFVSRMRKEGIITFEMPAENADMAIVEHYMRMKTHGRF